MLRQQGNNLLGTTVDRQHQLQPGDALIVGGAYRHDRFLDHTDPGIPARTQDRNARQAVSEGGNAKLGRCIDRGSAGALQRDLVCAIIDDRNRAAPGSGIVSREGNALAVVQHQFATRDIDGRRNQNFDTRAAQGGNVTTTLGQPGLKHGIRRVMVAQRDFGDRRNIGNRDSMNRRLLPGTGDVVLHVVIKIEQKAVVATCLLARGHLRLVPASAVIGRGNQPDIGAVETRNAGTDQLIRPARNLDIARAYLDSIG